LFSTGEFAGNGGYRGCCGDGTFVVPPLLFDEALVLT
jgi:hypothetical protein